MKGWVYKDKILYINIFLDNKSWNGLVLMIFDRIIIFELFFIDFVFFRGYWFYS